jgi:hypothetical protein
MASLYGHSSGAAETLAVDTPATVDFSCVDYQLVVEDTEAQKPFHCLIICMLSLGLLVMPAAAQLVMFTYFFRRQDTGVYRHLIERAHQEMLEISSP